MDLDLFRQILNAPNWQSQAQGLRAKHADWLLYQDSLTKKLQKKSPHFNVQVLYEGWSQGQLQAPQAENNWLREVLLKNGEQPWIFAQTLIPAGAWQQFEPELKNLGDTPIGLWLFAQQPQRLSLEWRQDPHSQLFARRSKLLVHNQQIQIQELFLQEFEF